MENIHIKEGRRLMYVVVYYMLSYYFWVGR